MSSRRLSHRRVEFSTEDIQHISEDLRKYSQKYVCNKFHISYDVLHRIMIENKLGRYKKIVDDPGLREHVSYLFTDTDLPLKSISEELNVEYMIVLTILHEMFSNEEFNSRSSRIYGNSKSGMNNPAKVDKIKHGHAKNYRGGQPCDDGYGYNLVPNNGVLDKSNNRLYHVDTGDQTWVYEHQKVFLPAVGLRKMPEGFVIHHIDGDRKNNELDNLALMSKGAHVRLHAHLKQHSEEEQI